MKKFFWLTIFSVIINLVLIVMLVVQQNSNQEMKSRINDLEEKKAFSFGELMDINAKYDFEAIEIIKSLGTNANCVDIGAHKGFFTEIFLENCPEGSHYAVEPLPHLYDELTQKFGDEVTVFSQALSNEKGSTTFNYIVSNPGYSGLKKRKTNREVEEVKEIEVELELLDNLIPESVDIDFMKIDVEGAEFLVLQGSKRILQQHKPIIIFEYGYDSRDLFGATPELVFDFFDSLGYKVSLMEYYLRNKPTFDRSHFIDHFNIGYNWYYVAYPG